MVVTLPMVVKAIGRAETDAERRLSQLVEQEDWNGAADADAYLRGLRFAKEIINMLRIGED